jgi:hypothetical protein
MKYQLQIEYADYKAAQRLHMTPRRPFKIILYFLLALFVLACCFAVQKFLKGGEGQDFGFLVGVTVYLFLMFGVLFPYRWKKNYQQQKLLHMPFQYEFTTDTFCTFTEYGNVALPWKTFHKWREGKTLFLVYQTDRLFHLIPKRIFQCPEDQAQLRGYLTEKIGKPVK